MISTDNTNDNDENKNADYVANDSFRNNDNNSDAMKLKLCNTVIKCIKTVAIIIVSDMVLLIGTLNWFWVD